MLNFQFITPASLHFGSGKISVLPNLIKTYGHHVILVTGAQSFIHLPAWSTLLLELEKHSITHHHIIIPSEPSPNMIDQAVEATRKQHPNVVVAIGGGSVLDAGKAIAAMHLEEGSVKSYLEGVGTKSPSGKTLPFIAVPTTSGTGSEATKNAVISEVGVTGFKRSLRHNNFVPAHAVLDPALTLACPPSITAASGMDAFTQLLESYLSTASNPISDALAFEGLKLVAQSLMTTYTDGTNLEARENMALASYLSGITLANAGLGVVHGFASVVGGYFPIAHGVVCSTLMTAANEITIQRLRERDAHHGALTKYARVGKLFTNEQNLADEDYVDLCLQIIKHYTHAMKIPTLRNLGITTTDFDKIVAQTESKNNPIALSKDDLYAVLQHSF
jgi:alcohol dehydrogenase class IV